MDTDFIVISERLSGLQDLGGLDHKQCTAATVPGVTTVHQNASSVRLRVEMPKWGDPEFVKVTDREVRTHRRVEYASGQ